MTLDDADFDVVRARLGRTPMADFEVVVRDRAGSPMVIRNAPLCRDGTPMPTRYWLVDAELNRAIATLEAEGAVRQAERAIHAGALARAHARYAHDRDEAIPRSHAGPRPAGGVGGTASGVKCLHAHYAWFLTGGDDPVGAWVHERLVVASRA